MPVERSRRGPLVACLCALLVTLACSGGDDTVDRADDAPAETSSSGGSSRGSDPTPAQAVTGDEVTTLRLGLAAIESFDPAATSPASPAQLLLTDLLYDTLTVIDDAGVAQPGLASFSANADQTVWRFEIDPEATFADGSRVTADDVAFSLERVLAGGRGSLTALRLERLAAISVSGTSTIDLSLTEPSAVLPELLASPLYAIASRDAIERVTSGGDPTPVASGDYTAAFDGADQLTLERRGGAGPDRIVVDLFDDEAGALDAFLAGDLDWTISPPDRIGEAAEVAGAAGLVPFQGGLFLGVDSGAAPLDEPAVRRAVALAIDRRAVADIVFGPTAEPSLGLIPAGLAGGAGDDCRGVCGPDRDEARSLLASALPDGQEQPLRIVVDKSETMQAVGTVLETQLADVGLEVQVDSLDVATYEELVAAGQPQLFVYGWLGVARSSASLLPALFDSASPDNVSGLADPDVDAALRAAQVDPIASSRAAAWRDVEAAILDRVPVVPLVQFRTTGVLGPRVRGFALRADGSVDLSDVVVDD